MHTNRWKSPHQSCTDYVIGVSSTPKDGFILDLLSPDQPKKCTRHMNGDAAADYVEIGICKGEALLCD